MALRLRQDEACLSELAMVETMDVAILRKMPPALRSRALERFLKDCGIREPEASHIAQAEALVFCLKPSAHARFPGGVIIGRCYDWLERQTQAHQEPETALPCPGTLEWNGYRIFCSAETEGPGYVLHPQGQLTVRSRKSGDSIRLNGGTKSLKKLFIDRKIPAAQRSRIPVICDEQGILGVYGIGVNQDRMAAQLQIRFETIENEKSEDTL
jgi:tRNA(Ile)-lysidine synthase